MMYPQPLIEQSSLVTPLVWSSVLTLGNIPVIITRVDRKISEFLESFSERGVVSRIDILTLQYDYDPVSLSIIQSTLETPQQPSALKVSAT